MPILARGAGSSLSGQAIGRAVILDCSTYLDKIEAIHAEERWVRVQPGVVINRLNRALRPFDLMLGPDPASAERATVGGSLANNATGAHSILYGICLLYTSPSPRDRTRSRMPSSALKKKTKHHQSNHPTMYTKQHI